MNFFRATALACWLALSLSIVCDAFPLSRHWPVRRSVELNVVDRQQQQAGRQGLEKRLVAVGSLTELGIQAGMVGMGIGTSAGELKGIGGKVNEALKKANEGENNVEPEYPKDKNGHCPNCGPKLSDQVDLDVEQDAMRAAMGAETGRMKEANTKAQQALDAQKAAFNDALDKLAKTQPEKVKKIKAYLAAHPNDANSNDIMAIMQGK
ncbi:hypothetical protein CBOM_06314 [Ceraceosorus bombacis]|uniref:Uncharacterized protein n=1 Tax=Ceraceosorus bombacis TaxID=401625 RepID=A0A0P1BS17_9BASI|nr:hypothetical protein CBOM_06314 [Ceraceosorus bombacis]